MYKIFDFSTLLYLGKLIYIQKSRNKQIFADPCKIKLEIKIGLIFSKNGQTNFWSVQGKNNIDFSFSLALLFNKLKNKFSFMCNL